MFIEKGGTGEEVALPQVEAEDDDFYLGKGTDENQSSKGLVGSVCPLPQAHGEIVQRLTGQVTGRVECMTCGWAVVW